MITTGVRNIIIGTMITTQCGIFGSSANTAYELVDKNNYNKVNHELKIKNNLADIKFKQLIQTCEEYKTIKDYEIEKKKKELKRQKQLQQEKEKEANSYNQSLSRGNDINSEWITVKVSYYTNDIHDCQKSDGISASGKNITDGGNYIAAPSDIPFNTQLEIEGLGVYKVVDRGGAIVDNNGIVCLDVFVPNTSQDQLNNMGVRYTKARIIK